MKMSAGSLHWPTGCRPGLRHGPAPERRAQLDDDRANALDRLASRQIARMDASRQRRSALVRAQRVAARSNTLADLSESELRTVRAALATRLRRARSDERHTTDALAHAMLAAERALGLCARVGQCIAAEALLHGQFVEMPTGEGKTLASALAAAAGALDGTPVHVLTANDYLAVRDATRLAPMYAALGLTSAHVTPCMDEGARRTAYAADIVHVTGKQLGFDWLHDALAGGAERRSLATRLGALTRPPAGSAAKVAGERRPVLRGLCFAIVDEADCLLVDEARTPLVLAERQAGEGQTERECVVALGLARMLDEGIDYRVLRQRRTVELTERGMQTLGSLAERIDGVWRASRYRDERVRQALAALHLWHGDRDYLVHDGQVVLIDEHTGRGLPDRRLQAGLHTLLEIKEQCEPTPEHEVVASIACQRLLRRYVRLAGTSGTLREVGGELAAVYRAHLVQVPPATPCRRIMCTPRVLPNRPAQLDALIDEVKTCVAALRPVLIGTRSVEQSKGVAALLSAHGIEHRVLDARQDGEEAAIVAGAGRLKRVTVATNMAGRGTDIVLGSGVAERGGLHVVSIGFNDARRIDRQLAGRAARQGDPGSFQQLWSLDDPALAGLLPESLRRVAQRWLLAPRTDRLASSLSRLLVTLAQRRLEHRHARERHAALESGERIARRGALGAHPDDPD